MSARALELFQAGLHEEAFDLYRSLGERRSNHPEVLHRLGFLATQFGEFDRAEALLRAAVRRAPRHPWVRNTLGILLRRRRRHAEAAEQFRAALRIEPGAHPAWNNLGNALRDAGRDAEALAAFRRALGLAPEVGYYWSAFGACLKHARFEGPPDAALRADVLRALTHAEVSPADVAPAARALLRADANVARLIEACARGEFDADARQRFAEPAIAQALRDPLLLALLESDVVADAELERALTRVRAALLALARARGAVAVPLATAAALARQCFLNLYAWFESPAEGEAADALAAELARAKADGAREDRYCMAVLAAYRPLASFIGTGVEAGEGEPAWQALARQQLAEPAEERRIAGEIRSLGASADATSRAVRTLYEENPYPRWERAGRFEHARPAVQVLEELFPGRSFARFPRGGVRVLVAGCGTGHHPIMTALRFADCRILAVDLSVASLAYAVRKTRELGLANIEYAQADLLALQGLDERFDVVESVGVLHHLRDPLEGWRALLARLAPHGAMRIGLYSERARRAIVHAQRLAQAGGYSAAPQSLRALRRALLDARDDAAAQQVTRNDDFYSLTGCRDMLLHVQEHRYTPLALAAALDALGLEFLGFELPDAGVGRRYAARFPEDPAQVDLARWERFEEDEPDTFFGMYQFWARRK